MPEPGFQDRIYALVATDDPSPVGFMNVFEAGDLWKKVRGCEACSLEHRLKCCGNCEFLVKEDGHCDREDNVRWRMGKPLYCCIMPTPDMHISGCALIYECTQGKFTGMQRRLDDAEGLLRDKTGRTISYANVVPWPLQI